MDECVYKLADYSLLKPTSAKVSAESGSRNSDHMGGDPCVVDECLTS